MFKRLQSLDKRNVLFSFFRQDRLYLQNPSEKNELDPQAFQRDAAQLRPKNHQ